MNQPLVLPAGLASSDGKYHLRYPAGNALGATLLWDYSAGFPTNVQSQFVGNTDANTPLFNGSEMVVINGAVSHHEAAGSWYTAKVDITAFTTEFSFQMGTEAVSGEAVATGDGTTPTWQHSLAGNGVGTADATIRPGSLTVTAGSVTGADDGNGNIVGTGVSGTIDYVSKLLTVTFSPVVANGVAITTSYLMPPYGMSFIIQDDPLGTAAAADANGLGYMTYTFNKPDNSIHNSVAIVFNLTPIGTGKAPSMVGFYLNGGPLINSGIYPLQDMAPQGIDLYAGHEMFAHVVYDGATLSLDLTDTATGAIAHFDWPVDIPAIVGANTAYIGFGGGTITAAPMSIVGWKWWQGANTRLPQPTFSPLPGAYTTTQSVTISAPSGASVRYTTNGTPPTQNSTLYSGPISISANECLQAISVRTGYTSSVAAYGNYQVQPSGQPTINFSGGFAGSSGLLRLSGNASLSGSVLRLIDGTNQQQIGSAFYVATIPVSTFSTAFTLQNIPGVNGAHNGVAFVIANQGQTEVANIGVSLAAAPSVNAVSANLSSAWSGGDSSYLVTFSDGETRVADFSGAGTSPYPITWSGGLANPVGSSIQVGRAGEVCVSGGPYSLGGQSGLESTYGYEGIGNAIAIVIDTWGQQVGLSVGGFLAEMQSMSGINTLLNPLDCTVSYDGTTLSFSVTDTVTKVNFSTSWTVDITTEVGASEAIAGFTATSSDSNLALEVTSWTM